MGPEWDNFSVRLFVSGALSLVCLGPLINIAVAIRMDPEFGKRLKDCHIMGGTYQGKNAVLCSLSHSN